MLCGDALPCVLPVFCGILDLFVCFFYSELKNHRPGWCVMSLQHKLYLIIVVFFFFLSIEGGWLNDFKHAIKGLNEQVLSVFNICTFGGKNV